MEEDINAKDVQRIARRLVRENEERMKNYDGGTVIASKSISIDNGFDKEKDVHTFTAVLKNGKIGIFLDDRFHPCYLFCDYLRNEEELNLFFDSIDTRSYLIDAQYRRESKTGYAESTWVCFNIEEMINDSPITICFSDGSWLSSNWDNEEKYPEWDLSASTRDDIIEEIKWKIEKIKGKVKNN